MYDLIFLATMTLVSPNHPTLESCQAAVRKIYMQKVDPMQVANSKELDEIVNSLIKYDAPKKYQCVKKG